MLQTTLTTIRTAARTLSSPISPHAAALRWTAYHSALDTERGDAVVFTVSSIAQLQSSLDAIEDGPLPKELVGEFEGVYELLGGGGGRGIVCEVGYGMAWNGMGGHGMGG
jgi:aflatoxin B1 aldehyde reductase